MFSTSYWMNGSSRRGATATRETRVLPGAKNERLNRNDAVAFGERGRLDRCFRRLAENLGTVRILTEW
jgi:hypothetical protein